MKMDSLSLVEGSQWPSVIFFILGIISYLIRRFQKGKLRFEISQSGLKRNLELFRLDELAIIIPARNEEENLFNLLSSLRPFKERGAQIIVADDHSTDATSEIAKSEGALLCLVADRPESWSGKNWACHQGFDYLEKTMSSNQIKYILFTDADTSHKIESFNQAFDYIKQNDISLLTARPFHLSPKFWQKLLGPFYELLYFVTNAYQSNPSPSRYFSIGQFLLFEKSFYKEIDGHKGIKEFLAEDLAFARCCFSRGKSFVVYPRSDLYSCNMYNSLADFFKGWERNIRLGFKETHWITVVEVTLLIGALLSEPHLIRVLIVIIIFWLGQKKSGNFSFLGPVLFPLSVFIFIALSTRALLKNLIQAPLFWKSRSYDLEIGSR